MKKYIYIYSVKINKPVVNFLHSICKYENFNPADMFLYLKNNRIYAGFSSDENLHVEINDMHWKPVYGC